MGSILGRLSRLFSATPTTRLSHRSRLNRFQSTTVAPMDETPPAALQPNGDDAPNVTKEEEQLPKLSMADFRAYNQMAEHMEYFHNHFRQTWNLMYQACSANKRPANMSIRQFLSTGLQFCHHLETHHSIEEYHFFPILARKMPAFQKELHLLTQHKQIHAGLEKFEEYLEECRSGIKELRLAEMKDIMDTFAGVLWSHLADEVKELGAENMRKYWSLEEMRRMPM